MFLVSALNMRWIFQWLPVILSCFSGKHGKQILFHEFYSNSQLLSFSSVSSNLKRDLCIHLHNKPLSGMKKKQNFSHNSENWTSLSKDSFSVLYLVYLGKQELRLGARWLKSSLMACSCVWGLILLSVLSAWLSLGLGLPLSMAAGVQTSGETTMYVMKEDLLCPVLRVKVPFI